MKDLRPWILALGAFAIGTDEFVVAGVLPAIAAELSVSVAAAGHLVTAFALSFALGAPLLATLTASWRRRHLLVTTLLLFILANFAAAASATFPQLLVARVLAALAGSLFVPTATAVVAELAPAEHRGRAIAVVMTGLTAAILLGVPIGAWIGAAAGWRACFVFVGGIGLLALAGVAFALPHTATPPALPLRHRLAPLTRPAILLALAVVFTASLGSFMTYTYIAPLLHEAAGVEGALVGTSLLVFGMASIVGSRLGGWGADTLGAETTMALSLVGMGAALAGLSSLAALGDIAGPAGPAMAADLAGAAAPTSPQAPWALPAAALLLALWGAAGWALSAPMHHRLISLAPAQATVVVGLNGAALYLGTGLGASLGSAIVERASAGALGWWGALLEAVALALLAASARVSRHERARGAERQVA